MIRLFNLTIVVFVFSTCSAYAIDCGPLEPVSDRLISKETQGEIDGEVTGLLSKLGGASAEIDGVFKEVIKGSTLSVYPEGAQLYVWEKLIFLKCELLADSDFSDARKSEEFDKLLKSLEIGPQAKCSFPLDPRAAKFDPPKSKNPLGPPKGFREFKSYQEIFREATPTEALKLAQGRLKLFSYVYGPYSQASYKAADVYAQIIKIHGTEVGHARTLVRLQNTYGERIGHHGCLDSL